MNLTEVPVMNEAAQSYGISVKMPKDDPMSASHLLGEDWVSLRWFDTPEERDAAIVEMQNHPRYYRRGDLPSIVLEKIDPA